MNHQNGIESVYTAHHASCARYGFSYRVSERGPQFADWIGTGKRVLDLGCRDGNLTSCYTANNTVTGVDIDRQALWLARQRLGITTVWLDLNREPLPFDNSSFDVAVAGELLEHLVHPEVVVGEVHRVLVPGGILIGSLPNSFHWRARLAFLRGRSIEDPTHLHLFSQSKVLELLQGFEHVEMKPIGGIGGRRLPIAPDWVSQPLVRDLPTVFANDFLFRAIK